MFRKIIALAIVSIVGTQSVLADYKISQQRTVESMGMEITVYSKGVRERREQKFLMDADPQMLAMMEQMMPNLTLISQCDIKQDVQVNPKYRSFFVDYHDWSTVPPDKLARRPRQKVTVKGTATISSTVVDSGRRQQMYGLTARWATHTLEIESSADSCDGASKVKIVKEGWFVTLSLESKSCSTPRPPAANDSGCRPRMITKAMQDPGFMLSGTTTSYENGKKQMVETLETTALSKAILDQSLFEIPVGFTEVDSMFELMKPIAGSSNNTAVTSITGTQPGAAKPKNLKTVAIDYFSGSSSKLDQNSLRSHISNKVSAAGMSGFMVTSQADLQTGNFANVIAVDIKKAKESGGAKIGGLFGKITGSDAGSSVGDSTAEITITIFAQDRKTIVATGTATEKVKGNANDAVRAAIDQVIAGLLAKIK